MHVLFIGDIVGKPGRSCIRGYLPEIKKERQIDLIIANGENAAGGAGMTKSVFKELTDTGIDVVTGGNHIWDRREIFDFIDYEARMIRPANYPKKITPGKGSFLVEREGIKTAVINLIGRVFMGPADCPFQWAECELHYFENMADIIIVDFHAEATSEKQAMGWFLDGRVSAVIGTHSHVQTADRRILPGNTAYITDVGMVGLYDSILGVDREGPIKRFRTGLPCRLEISDGRTVFNAVVVEVDERSGKAVSIESIFKVFDEAI